MDAAVLEWLEKQVAPAGYVLVPRNRIKTVSAYRSFSRPLLDTLPKFEIRRMADKQMVDAIAQELMASPFVVRREFNHDDKLDVSIWTASVLVIEDERPNAE